MNTIINDTNKQQAPSDTIEGIVVSKDNHWFFLCESGARKVPVAVIESGGFKDHDEVSTPAPLPKEGAEIQTLTAAVETADSAVSAASTPPDMPATPVATIAPSKPPQKQKAPRKEHITSSGLVVKLNPNPVKPAPPAPRPVSAAPAASPNPTAPVSGADSTTPVTPVTRIIEDDDLI